MNDKWSKNAEYKRQNYDRVELLIPKGVKSVWKQMADINNISINRLVILCVLHYMQCHGDEDITNAHVF